MQNGIQDESGFAPLQTQVDEDQLKVERAMAKFAQHPEFKRIKQHFEERKIFYRTYLPDGRALTDVSNEERGQMWLVANAIIGELDSILTSYELASEAVKSAQ